MTERLVDVEVPEAARRLSGTDTVRDAVDPAARGRVLAAERRQRVEVAAIRALRCGLAWAARRRSDGRRVALTPARAEGRAREPRRDHRARGRRPFVAGLTRVRPRAWPRPDPTPARAHRCRRPGRVGGVRAVASGEQSGPKRLSPSVDDLVAGRSASTRAVVVAPCPTVWLSTRNAGAIPLSADRRVEQGGGSRQGARIRRWGYWSRKSAGSESETGLGLLRAVDRRRGC